MVDPDDPASPGRQGRAKRRKPAGASAAIVPQPPALLKITPVIWTAGTVLHRIHLDTYAANAFNPGLLGNARFSPIVNAAGKPIPTLCAGSSFDCAAMETVFHDVPFAPGLKTWDKRKLQGQLHSLLKPMLPLTLADLRNVPLRKLGVERKQMIDTEKDTYARTRLWAEAIHAQHAHVQGLCWTARQDDRAMAVMLFGDRIRAGVLATDGMSRPLLDEPAYMQLLGLADAIGVRVVDGRA
jgi:RES domain